MVINLDDVTQCPLEDHCTICGTTTCLDITATFSTSIGVMCATLCRRCVDNDRPMPRLSVLNVARRIAAHCEHLGINLDQMAEALESEKVM